MDPTLTGYLNTALLSIISTLATVIYLDMRRNNSRTARQVMVCLSTLIAIVNHIEHLPEHILQDLHEALKSK